MFRKYASVDLRGHRPAMVTPRQNLSTFGSFSFKPRPGYIYPRVRAISARINKNYDGFPSIELQKAAQTFVGRPVFVNHNNHDHERTRGVILASQYHGLSEDPHITILPEVDALTFPNLARDIINGDMDSVSMGCDVDNSTCSYCGNVATTAEEFCDHILNNKGQELTKLVNGRPMRILVYEICRGLNFFEISFVFDPADETAVMQEVIVPEGIKMTSNIPMSSSYTAASGAGVNITWNTLPEMSRTASNAYLAYGEMIAPPKVDTLRDDDVCPQCGSDFNGVECDNCNYITPPEELQDPDTQAAGSVREGDDDSDGDNGNLDYFGDDDEDSDDQDEDESSEDEEPNPYDLYQGQPRKEGNAVSRTAVRPNVDLALGKHRLAEAQRRLRALGEEYPLNEEGVDTGENIASPPPAPEAAAPCDEGSDHNDNAGGQDHTDLQNLDDEQPAGDWGDREEIQTVSNKKPLRRRAEDLDNAAQARPDDEQNVEAPVANMVNDDNAQYKPDAWATNSPLDGFDNEHLDETSTEVPDGKGSTPMQTGAATKLAKASASQVYQLADLYTELNLVPHEQRYAAIAEIEKMPAIVAAHTIKVLARVKEVFATQMPQGRVARTASAIPALGKTASARTPSMARQAETRRLAASAEDTLLLF